MPAGNCTDSPFVSVDLMHSAATFVASDVTFPLHLLTFHRRDMLQYFAYSSTAQEQRIEVK